MRPSWDDSFLELAQSFKKRSKDQSTQLAAVIVDSDNVVVAIGYNCFPRGTNDNLSERQIRPKKYLYVEHAERNALYGAARKGFSLRGCRMYAPWFPCADCARGIIQCGLIEVIVVDMSVPKRWFDSFYAGAEMLLEAGVRIRQPNSTKLLSLTDLEVENG